MSILNKYIFWCFFAKIIIIMGCGINKGQHPKVYPSLNMIQLKTNNAHSPRCISQKTWINIIDYLNYSELKEVGKINRAFNYLARQNKILIKFFKKKNDQSRQMVGRNINIIYSKKIFDSFCLLQNCNNKDNSVSDYSTSSEEKAFLFHKKRK